MLLGTLLNYKFFEQSVTILTKLRLNYFVTKIVLSKVLKNSREKHVLVVYSGRKCFEVGK